MPKIVGTHAVRGVETWPKGRIGGGGSIGTDPSTRSTASTCQPMSSASFEQSLRPTYRRSSGPEEPPTSRMRIWPS